MRKICHATQAGNINAVNYYFGTKETLYKTILDKMFAAQQTQMAQYPVPATPLEHLKTYICSYCAMLYAGGEMARDMVKIFTAEMARPSKILDKIVEKHTKPEALAIMASVRKLLGPAVPEDAVRDTCVSIGSQIIYYSYAWPVFSQVFPDHPGMAAYHAQLAEHIFRFSLVRRIRGPADSPDAMAPGRNACGTALTIRSILSRFSNHRRSETWEPAVPDLEKSTPSFL